MGSFGAGLASVGESIAQARELQRQQRLEDIKLQLEQSRLGVEQENQRTSQTYADIARMREQRLGKDENKPYNLQWKLSGNTMVVAGQNPDGSPFVQSFPVSKEIGWQIQALKDEINSAPPEVQPYLNAMTAASIAEGDITKASNDIKPVMQQLAKQAGTPDTVRTGMQGGFVEIPGYGPVWVQVPTTTTTTRVPPTRMYSAPGAAAPAGSPQGTVPMTSPATDFPNAPQSGLVQGTTSGVPNIPLPPGSRILGLKPPPASKKNTGELKPEMQAGLRVLHTSLFGSPSMPGLESTVGVLDSEISAAKLIFAGVGTNPNPNEWKVSKLVERGFYKMMTPAEKNYVYQLNRAVSAINGLRSITGLPRSTQQLMDRYVLELPNPKTTPSSKDARYQLQLIEREIQAAMQDVLNPGTGGSGTDLGIPTPVAPAQTQPAGVQPTGGLNDTQKRALDQLLNKKP